MRSVERLTSFYQFGFIKKQYQYKRLQAAASSLKVLQEIMVHTEDIACTLRM